MYITPPQLFSCWFCFYGPNSEIQGLCFSSSPQKMKYILTMQSVPHERVLHVRVYSTPVVTELSVNHTIALQSMAVYGDNGLSSDTCFCLSLFLLWYTTLSQQEVCTMIRFVCTCTSFNFSHEINVLCTNVYTWYLQ